MATWREFRDRQPELAAAGNRLFYQYGGVGLAFMATVRKDGGPRLHPMCPIIDDDGLYALIVPSPKREDLMRDGRYALHAFPPEDNKDAFYVTGSARLIEDAGIRARLAAQFCAERGAMDPALVTDELPFEFDIATCLWTQTAGHGDRSPKHTIWRGERAIAGD